MGHIARRASGTLAGARVGAVVRGRRSGFTLVEVAISAVVVAFLAMAAATAFTGNLRSVEDAGRITAGSIFLETVMEDLSAQPYDNLLVLNGNRFYDVIDANDSNYEVALTVFQSANRLLQLEAVMTDLRTGRALGAVTTARADR